MVKLIDLQIIFAGVALLNFLTAPRLRNAKNQKHNIFVSVLVPARNEETRIPALLQSLEKNSHGNTEYLFYDDHSTDGTRAILEEWCHGKNARVIKGSALPSGWLGKNYACFELSKEAQGNILIFIDADVVLSANAIAKTVSRIEQKNLQFLSVFPGQITKSFGELLLVPLMDLLLLSFLPLLFVRITRVRSFLAANGQFMAFRSDAYEQIGTHSAVRHAVVEDMALASIVRQKRMRMETMLGAGEVSCRMYNNLSDAWKGFQKNLFPGFKSLFRFLPLVSVMLIIFLFPLVACLITGNWLYVGIIALHRLLVSASNGGDLRSLWLHPIALAAFAVASFQSWQNSRKGNIQWKDRNVF